MRITSRRSERAARQSRRRRAVADAAGCRAITTRKIPSPIAWEITVASPAPSTPSRGAPRLPKMSTQLPASLTTVIASATAIGVRMSRFARSALSITIAAASINEATSTSCR